MRDVLRLKPTIIATIATADSVTKNNNTAIIKPIIFLPDHESALRVQQTQK